MKCKHCGKDSDEEAWGERQRRLLREALEEEGKNPVVYKEDQLRRARLALSRGCFFVNYQKGRLSIFEPNGGCYDNYVFGAAADELGAIYDAHNFNLRENRLRGECGKPGECAPETREEKEAAIQYWAVYYGSRL